MRMRAARIVFYISTFAVVFVLGNLFGEAFWQAGIHAEKTLEGKPLPSISAFFIRHYHLPGHLALLPWLGLVGAPLLTRSSTKDYWDSHSFCFRYLAFLSVEIVLFIVLLLALELPFIPHYIANPPHRQTGLELIVRLIFWFSTVLVILLAIRRTHQTRNDRHA